MATARRPGPGQQSLFGEEPLGARGRSSSFAAGSRALEQPPTGEPTPLGAATAALASGEGADTDTVGQLSPSPDAIAAARRTSAHLSGGAEQTPSQTPRIPPRQPIWANIPRQEPPGVGDVPPRATGDEVQGMRDAYRQRAQAEGRGARPAPPAPPAPPSPLLHPFQFVAHHMGDPEVAGGVNQGVATAQALARLHRPGGITHLLDFAEGRHLDPRYAVQQAAVDDVVRRMR